MEGQVVAGISFEGNGNSFSGTGDYSLRATLEQEQNAAFTWIAPAQRRIYLNQKELELDGWRLETWYAHHGFFDATFQGWDVRTVRQGTERLPPKVRIVGHVDGGPESAVRHIQWGGMEGVGRPLLAKLKRDAELQVRGPQ